MTNKLRINIKRIATFLQGFSTGFFASLVLLYPALVTELEVIFKVLGSLLVLSTYVLVHNILVTVASFVTSPDSEDLVWVLAKRTTHFYVVIGCFLLSFYLTY